MERAPKAIQRLRYSACRSMAMATSKSQSWRDQGSGSVGEAQGIAGEAISRGSPALWDFQTQKVVEILISWELAFHAGTTTA